MTFSSAQGQTPLQTKLRIRRSASAVLRIMRSVGIGYLLVLGGLVLFERSLLYPIPNAASGDWNPPGVDFEDVYLTAADGTKLHGWYLPSDSPRAAIVFFHGNGEDLASCGPEMSHWRKSLHVSVLAMDYRGYGRSEGKPSESLLVEDGVLSAKWLADRQGTSLDQIILWGRSIGGGVAAGVAEVINPRAMFMESTFDSLANVAAEHVRWAPVRWLMTNQYRSAKRLATYRGRFIQWHGDKDPVVSLASGKRLFAAVGSDKKSFFLGSGYGHSEDSPDDFKAAIRSFIETP